MSCDLSLPARVLSRSVLCAQDVFISKARLRSLLLTATHTVSPWSKTTYSTLPVSFSILEMSRLPESATLQAGPSMVGEGGSALVSTAWEEWMDTPKEGPDSWFVTRKG